MVSTGKIWLRNKGDEYTTLYVRYNYTENGRKKNFNYSTGERIKTEHWDDEEKRLKTRVSPKADAMNNKRINRRLDEIQDAIAESVVELKSKGRTLDGLADLVGLKLGDAPQNAKSLIDHFKDIKKARERGEEFTKGGQKYKHNTTKTYGTSILWLQKYEKRYKTTIFPEDIDLTFYNRFVALMAEENLSTNGMSAKIKHVKMVMNLLLRRGLTTNQKHNDPAFSKMEEAADTIYLNEEELQRMIDLSLPPHLDRARDLFIVGCYTGLRVSDYNLITPANFVFAGRMIKKVVKKGHQTVYIPIHPIVRKIVDKYDGVLPRRISEQKLRKHIKEIAKRAGIDQMEEFRITKGAEVRIESMPRYKKVSTHTARRSFATNWYLAGGDPLSIMPITGHSTIQNFLKYIRVTSEQHALRMLENHEWFKV